MALIELALLKEGEPRPEQPELVRSRLNSWYRTGFVVFRQSQPGHGKFGWYLTKPGQAIRKIVSGSAEV